MDLEQRVAAIADRIGHSAPPINRIEGSDRQPCAFTVPPGPIGPALVVHNHLEQKSEQLQDHLIAQALIADRLGANEEFKVVVWSIRAVLIVLIGVFAGVAAYVANTYGWPTILVIIAAFVIPFSVSVLTIAIWSRAFVRRQDNLYLRLFGREKLIEGLRLDIADRPRPITFYWIRMGMRPRPTERLRRLR